MQVNTPLFFLSQIREETDTKIELPPDSSDSDIIVITGRKENVEKACSRIKAIEKEMVSGTSLFPSALLYLVARR